MVQLRAIDNGLGGGLGLLWGRHIVVTYAWMCAVSS
jgi:hypothetical protein